MQSAARRHHQATDDTADPRVAGATAESVHERTGRRELALRGQHAVPSAVDVVREERYAAAGLPSWTARPRTHGRETV